MVLHRVPFTVFFSGILSLIKYGDYCTGLVAGKEVAGVDARGYVGEVRGSAVGENGV